MILCSGAFDGLHAGHVRYLQAARNLRVGETLRVAVAPDSYIRKVKHRDPYWSQSDRAHTVFALACVDVVTLQRTDSVAEVIRDCKPGIFVKGTDWIGKLPEDVLDACHEVGADILYVKAPGRHTREARR